MHIANEPPERGSYNFLLFCFELDALYGEIVATGHETKKSQVIPWPEEWPVIGGPFAVRGPKGPGDMAACVFVNSRYTRDELMSRGPHWFDKTDEWFALLEARAAAAAAAAAAAEAKADEEAAAAAAAAAEAARLAEEAAAQKAAEEAELERLIAEEEAAKAKPVRAGQGARRSRRGHRVTASPATPAPSSGS